MKAALGGLALACLSFLTQFNPAIALEHPASANAFAGIPFSNFQSRASISETYSYALSLDKTALDLINCGAFKEAEGRLRQSLVFEPQLVQTHCNLGYVLNKTGRAREALQHLLYAYNVAPNEPAVVQSLAASYQLCGDFKNSIELYSRYLSCFPQAKDSSFIRGVLQHLKSESAIIAKREKGKGLDPNKNYRWQKQLVKVYISSGEGLLGFRQAFNNTLRKSFARWSEAGVLKFTFVSNPAEADIECIWTDRQANLSSSGEGGEAILKHSGRKVCHARITLLTQREGGGRLSEQELKSLCLHEIGHALGLMEHSACPNDVMFSTLASTSDASQRDFSLLRSLY